MDDDKKPEGITPEEKKPGIRRLAHRRLAHRKPEEKKPEDKKSVDKKPEDRKPESKKPVDKKPQEYEQEFLADAARRAHDEELEMLANIAIIRSTMMNRRDEVRTEERGSDGKSQQRELERRLLLRMNMNRNPDDESKV